jgi:hypothetical protein
VDAPTLEEMNAGDFSLGLSYTPAGKTKPEHVLFESGDAADLFILARAGAPMAGRTFEDFYGVSADRISYSGVQAWWQSLKYNGPNIALAAFATIGVMAPEPAQVSPAVDLTEPHGMTAEGLADTFNTMQGGPDGAPAAESVWALQPLKRGVVIEDQLGHNLPRNFPVIDRFDNGLASSIKSIDLGAKTYQDAATLNRTLRSYVNDVAGFNGRNWAGVNIPGSSITGRELILATPRSILASQQTALTRAIEYGASRSVTVRVVPVD